MKTSAVNASTSSMVCTLSGNPFRLALVVEMRGEEDTPRRRTLYDVKRREPERRLLDYYYGPVRYRYRVYPREVTWVPPTL